jgi:hypothetical protein
MREAATHKGVRGAVTARERGPRGPDGACERGGVQPSHPGSDEESGGDGDRVRTHPRCTGAREGVQSG